ncbi:glycosyl hydrolase catalytic core-domain-containing protein [Phaeosphaeriaceae sp. PMI808]|nr:glycosyl hydrolase catalytic core-domain-containing protein [Phaeosphaeriaceae sp. PMI808]
MPGYQLLPPKCIMYLSKMFVGTGITLIAMAKADTGARIPPAEVPDHPNVRRGLAYNRPDFVRYFDVQGNYLRWIYNWDSKSQFTNTGFEYVPMLHSNRPDHTGPWKRNVEAAVSVVRESPTHLLGFNEPDMCQPGGGGSCMSVQEAVDTWQKHMEPLKSLKPKMYFGSPAVTNSGGSNEGLEWLRKFLEQCHDCKVDFICIHWYDSAKNFAYFKQHIEETRKVAQGRPIWITEFKASGSDEEAMRFMDEALPWLDGTSDIHRYAYFMASSKLLVNSDGTHMSDLGKHYSLMTTDKEA